MGVLCRHQLNQYYDCSKTLIDAKNPPSLNLNTGAVMQEVISLAWEAEGGRGCGAGGRDTFQQKRLLKEMISRNRNYAASFQPQRRVLVCMCERVRESEKERERDV